MNLQDRAYAVGIFIVLGICCIGAYVAVSGFTNVNPSGLNLSLNSGSPTPSAVTTLDVSTATPGAATVPPLPTSTAARAVTTPGGSQPTPTSLTHGTPTPAFLADIPTITLAATSVVSSPTPAAGSCGYPFCPQIGRPDAAMAPTGLPCPINYIWGVVYDKNGAGIPNMEIHYQQLGGASDQTMTKGPPDTRIGGYDIPAGGGTWVLQLFAGGQAQSSQFRIQAHQAFTGGSTCPTRVDFVEQR
jgi:hypothetical protein